MVLGTSSGAGKSLMTAALCRLLKRRGETPLPFKGQNMSLNAWVDQAGGEMAYSQALQARGTCSCAIQGLSRARPRLRGPPREADVLCGRQAAVASATNASATSASGS